MAALYFSIFRFGLKPLEPLRLPAHNKGNVLRGAFGTMLRRLCCHPQCPGATRCELRLSCPYAVLFEPAAPPDATGSLFLSSWSNASPISTTA